MSRKRLKGIPVKDSIDCPRCPGKTRRYQHPAAWTPKPDQEYYYKYWDYCRSCGFMQHYEVAKVWVRNKPGEPERGFFAGPEPSYRIVGDTTIGRLFDPVLARKDHRDPPW